LKEQPYKNYVEKSFEYEQERMVSLEQKVEEMMLDRKRERQGSAGLRVPPPRPYIYEEKPAKLGVSHLSS